MTDQELAEILTLTCEVDGLGNIKYRNSAGKKHRIHGPAVILSDGGESWWLDGMRHRVGGPADTWADGTQLWYQCGQMHRTDGPAAIHADGTKWWYKNGYECNPG